MPHRLVGDPATLPRVDGAHRELWEPLWKLRISLQDVEVELLRTPDLRRLHYLRHNGSAYVATAHTYSRLQHTLGVFALVAHLRQDDTVLRVAALLHDVGHAPFSHTLETIDGVDHHAWTAKRVRSSSIAGVLARHAIVPDDVLQLVDGERHSLLRNTDAKLQCDHLDSFVRSAATRGILAWDPQWLLSRLVADEFALRFDTDAAELMAELIVEEAAFHLGAANIATGVALRELVRALLARGQTTLDELADMTDARLETLLLEHRTTRAGAWRLFYEPHRLRVRTIGEDDEGSGAELDPTIRIDRLYLAMPHDEHGGILRRSLRLRSLVDELERRLGRYAVEGLLPPEPVPPRR
ncbi:MAG: HD domain-containing protein [Trueperaceae bacterium]